MGSSGRALRPEAKTFSSDVGEKVFLCLMTFRLLDF